ncbi:TetR family transcriptional regulator [Lentzea atacamensis]|uniref:TetR family transcriptional regulator n=1 Tax=Lentzea atacamensis TaxID=531938 RepID=A0A316ITJ9_9PSEU|nr:TetR/AcrR family transcriptional regulator [Lentzea atacamensis]PWK90505.1 TetR family transcriptional regulator [Lentzea atacamensis]RAS68270.1 TetR family transcriptional regulator [Lentzea atacamensis]
MGRWEPDARDRLVRAALDLFSEQGYENTAVAQIAERAGLTKSTYFRHFRDKREVLFGGQDEILELLAGGIAGAPASAGALVAVEAALVAIAVTFTEERRANGPRRLAVIASNDELRERDALKMTGFAAAMVDALKRRGVSELGAEVAAELGVLALRRAYSRWLEAGGDFAEVARRALEEVSATAAALERAE